MIFFIEFQDFQPFSSLPLTSPRNSALGDSLASQTDRFRPQIHLIFDMFLMPNFCSHAYACMRMHAYAYAYAYACIAGMHMHARICMHMHKCICRHAYACMHMQACICMHAYACMRMHFFMFNQKRRGATFDTKQVLKLCCND